MKGKIFFIHTASGLTDAFNKLCDELVKEASRCHISDEILIQAVLTAGGLTPAIYRRMAEHVVAAEQSGAQLIQVTCSSVSPCVDVIRRLVSIPVLKIDEPMAEHAVRNYRRIGMIATNPGTLKPSTELVKNKAEGMGCPVELRSSLCTGAFEAFLAGDLRKHDQIVKTHLQELIDQVEVVLLVQASMARVAETLEPSLRKVPILSSPRLAIERLASLYRSG